MAIGPTESFNWDDQPIEFAPPPGDWERQPEKSGGLLGTRFVKYESGGQAIHIAEVSDIGHRDRCSETKSLIRDWESLSNREFAKRLQEARPYITEAVNEVEEEAFGRANEELNEARLAFRSTDREDVESHLSTSLWYLETVAYTLDEVLPFAHLDGEDLKGLGEIEFSEPESISVDDTPALLVRYTFHSTDKDQIFQGRKVYIQHNNRLFEASFLGVEEYVPLFEAIVESISFPAGSCDHSP